MTQAVLEEQKNRRDKQIYSAEVDLAQQKALPSKSDATEDRTTTAEPPSVKKKSNWLEKIRQE